MNRYGSPSPRGRYREERTVGRWQKRSYYFSKEVHADMVAEARRQDRTLSWLMQRAWQLARAKIRTFDSSPGLTDGGP